MLITTHAMTLCYNYADNYAITMLINAITLCYNYADTYAITVITMQITMLVTASGLGLHQWLLHRTAGFPD